MGLSCLCLILILGTSGLDPQHWYQPHLPFRASSPRNKVWFIHREIQIVPQKMIIRLSASISFEIVNWSEYALEQYNYYQLSASQRKPQPIWFSSHKEIRIYIRKVIRPFHPNFDRQETHTTQWTLNSTLLLNGLCRCIYTKLGWKGLMTYQTKIHISPRLL